MSDEKLGLEDVSYLRSLGDKAANGQYAIGRQWFYDFARRLEITLDELGDTRELKAALRWIPVEEREPPKDGSEVLLRVKFRAGIAYGTLVGHWMRGGHCIEDHPPIESGWYFWNGTMFDRVAEPTHWMALPGDEGL